MSKGTETRETGATEYVAGLKARAVVALWDGDTVVVHTSPNAWRVVWSYAAHESDAMKPIDGWAVLVRDVWRPGRPHDMPQINGHLDDPSYGTPVTVYRKNGSVLAALRAVPMPPVHSPCFRVNGG